MTLQFFISMSKVVLDIKTIALKLLDKILNGLYWVFSLYTFYSNKFLLQNKRIKNNNLAWVSLCIRGIIKDTKGHKPKIILS